MRHEAKRRLIGRLSGAAAASGLVLAGVVATAAPASAAACSGTSGVTVVVDTGSSTSTRCASGDPSSAWKALTGAGYTVTPVAQFPGAICQIDGYPNTACLRMPPADAYWAFFYAKRGGTWTYSSSGATSYNPAPGTVVGFRFGSGQQPRVDPPDPTPTSEPEPTTAPTTTAPKATTSAPRQTSATTAASGGGSGSSGSSSSAPRTAGSSTGTPSPSGSVSAVPTPSGSPSGSASGPAAPPDGTGPSATPIVAAPTSATGDQGAGLGTLLAGGALVALVAAGAGWAAWKRRA